MSMLPERCEEVAAAARAIFAEARSEAELFQQKAAVFGKKGSLTALLRMIPELPPEERRSAGQTINQLKQTLSAELDARARALRESAFAQVGAGRIDVTLPGRDPAPGALHPVIQTWERIVEIFHGMGFQVESGPGVETDYHNFEALNMPAHHPARQMQDTFYLPGGRVLRTHTSPVQSRVMRRQKPPIAIIAPGVVYRCDSDRTHTPMFHQVEGLVVDEGITFAHLKGTLLTFVRELFGKKFDLRFRPSYFPFTEPSAEVDMWDGTRWLEIGGCGMVNPRVFQLVDDPAYDPDQISGFAFGMGIDRIAMLLHGIPDLRALFTGDVRLLRQFR